MSLPQVKPDDMPPLLRFENASIEDRAESIKQGRFVYQPVVKVYVRAHGDTKSETPFLVEGPHGWLAQLKEKLHHKFITQNYYDFCLRSWKRYQETGEVPEEGTPIKGWNMLSDAQQRMVLNAQITTVEKLAEATEEAMAVIGMGAREMKKKAQHWLESDTTRGQAAAKIAALEAEREAMVEREAKANERLSQLERKLAELSEKPKRKKEVETE